MTGMQLAIGGLSVPSGLSYAGFSGSGAIKPILCIKVRRINAGTTRVSQFIEKFCYDRLLVAQGDRR